MFSRASFQLHETVDKRPIYETQTTVSHNSIKWSYSRFGNKIWELLSK